MKLLSTITAVACIAVFSFAIVHPAHAALFKGVVTEVNPDRIEMMGTDMRGMSVWHKFRITHNTWVKNGVLLFDVSRQVRQEVRNEIQRGSVVTVWYTPGHEALIIQNMAPKNLGEAYGPGDCSHCGK